MERRREGKRERRRGGKVFKASHYKFKLEARMQSITSSLLYTDILPGDYYRNYRISSNRRRTPFSSRPRIAAAQSQS